MSIFTRPSAPQRRVVVTGMSMITPLGLNLKESWSGLINGKSGVGRITLFDPTAYDAKIAGEVKGFNSDEWIPKKEQKKMDRFIHFAIAASKMAMTDADFTRSEDRRVGKE